MGWCRVGVPGISDGMRVATEIHAHGRAAAVGVLRECMCVLADCVAVTRWVDRQRICQAVPMLLDRNGVDCRRMVV